MVIKTIKFAPDLQRSCARLASVDMALKVRGWDLAMAMGEACYGAENRTVRRTADDKGTVAYVAA